MWSSLSAIVPMACVAAAGIAAMTAEAFRAITRFSKPLGIEAYRRMIDDDLLAHAPSLTNDFEEPIFFRHPRLREYKQALLASGAAWAAMTGSGSTPRHRIPWRAGPSRSPPRRINARARCPERPAWHF